MTTRYSASLTNLDATASPFIVKPNTAGEGAAGTAQIIDDYVTTVSSDAAGVIYRVLRVRTNIKAKSLVQESEAMTAGKVQVGVYYSDSAFDGTTPANQIAAAISSNFFANDLDLTSAVTPTNITNQSGSYTLDKRNQPLWQALALASDPGGWFDICATVHTTTITTGAKFGLRLEFVGS